MSENDIKSAPDSKTGGHVQSLNNISIGEIRTKVYKYRGIEILEVNRSSIDKIRQYADKAMPVTSEEGISHWKCILNRPFWKEIWLGLFGTFLGLLIEGFKDAVAMLKSADGGVPGNYVIYLLAAITTFSLFRKMWNAENQSSAELIRYMEQIREEIDGIYADAPVDNELGDSVLIDQLDNHLPRRDKDIVQQ